MAELRTVLTSVDPQAIIAAIRRGRPHRRYVVWNATDGLVLLTDYVAPLTDVILDDDDEEQ